MRWDAEHAISGRRFLPQAGAAAAGATALALVGPPRLEGAGAPDVRAAQAQGGYYAWAGAAGVDPSAALADGSAAWRWNPIRRGWEVYAAGVSVTQGFEALSPQAYFLSEAPSEGRFVVEPGSAPFTSAAESVQIVPGFNLLVYQGRAGAPVREVLAAATGAVSQLSRVDKATGEVSVFVAELGASQALRSLRTGAVYSARIDGLVHVGMPFESGLPLGIEA